MGQRENSITRKKGARHIDFGDRVVDPLVGGLFAGAAFRRSELIPVFRVAGARPGPLRAGHDNGDFLFMRGH